MQMSVTRALAELKLLDKRIEKETTNLVAAKAVVKDTLDSEDNKKFKAESEAQLNKVKALINNAYTIKAAIIQSNAATKVNISGKDMTVAEAIAKKDLIEFEKALERRLSFCITTATTESTRSETAARSKGEQIAAALANEDKGMFDKIYQSFMDKNTTALLVSDKIKNERDALDRSIDEFEKEVDFVLSESNTRTIIDVNI